MAHEIESNVDRVITYGDRAWHLLDENHKNPLTKEMLTKLFIPYLEGEASVPIEGTMVPLKGWKSIVADVRKIDDIDEDFRPVHVARDRYEILQNEVLFDALEDALSDIPHEIVSAGTLGGLQYFFASVKFTEDFNINLPDGSECKAFFSMFSSHNGTKNANYYDTTLRTECMNLLRASFAARGEQGFAITHTKNASLRIHNMAEIVNNIFKGRKQFEEKMAELYTIPCDLSTAEKFTAGYLAEKTDAKGALSTRSRNQMSEIVALAWNGAGNKGDNMFYLGQGATEFWTRGNGTGSSNRDMGKKAFSAEFGSGMDNKLSFMSALADENTRNKMIKRGDLVLSVG